MGGAISDYVQSINGDVKVYYKRTLFMSIIIAFGLYGLQPKLIPIIGEGLYPFLCVICGWNNLLFESLFNKLGVKFVKKAEQEIDKKLDIQNHDPKKGRRKYD
ncbi:MAG: hypothetical protein OMM_09390 [Candidatus Magnetoglobus multicellularis str. Araruama]|uniref:Uncharacterized protein n=1 Tax=Candidatus Magnetoglobus multicellularis str. Araruama TaxID=890399 RepID=A0A1V1P4G3_9BACT|nr:MAG: hypothetical protein OMM_09390 [Candidatus Magnetoglobus multicellularis str. Araruama]